MFARTTDGGINWEPARNMFRRNANLWTIGHQVAVLPNGTLLDVFNLSRGSGKQPSPNQNHQAVMRSTDKGITLVGSHLRCDRPRCTGPRPATGDLVARGTFLPDIAVAQNNGTAYVV